MILTNLYWNVAVTKLICNLECERLLMVSAVVGGGCINVQPSTTDRQEYESARRSMTILVYIYFLSEVGFLKGIIIAY